jgi:hypothetical protein
VKLKLKLTLAVLPGGAANLACADEYAAYKLAAAP